MSGAFLQPPTRTDADWGVLFVEVSGLLPMCGHGTIGTITIALEEGLIQPKTPGFIRMEAPAGLVLIEYKLEGKKVKDDVLIVRALYRNNDGEKKELLFRVENGKVTARGFNKFGDDWRNHMDEVMKEFK